MLELCYGEHYKNHKSIDVSPHNSHQKIRRSVIMLYIYYTIGKEDSYTLYPDIDCHLEYQHDILFI